MTEAKTVLVIDDEPAILLGLSTMMERSGYQVLTAADGKEGLDQAKNEQPDLIVSDVMMPPPNGFELRQLLSQDPELADIPFIFLTARTDKEDKLMGIRSGGDDYITKPFDREELMLRVESVFRRVRLERDHGRNEMEVTAKKEMEKLKREILQNFHHELRTPLVNVMLPLEIALKNKFDDPEQQLEFIHTALANTNRMGSLVEDLILLSSVDHGALNTIRQEIDPEVDIDSLIEKTLAQYEDKDLDVVVNKKISTPIFMPRVEFKRALYHLLSNACKFTQAGGKVTLDIFADEDTGCEIRVQDNGPGIPAAMRSKVFERFFQISQGDNRDFEGLGVGLTIAQAVAESLGGNVQILDSDSGCSIRMSIPPGENEWSTK